MPFTIAIVGRPNVGKSTLFNRLTGKRQALTDDEPGVTRDVREGKGQLGDLEFRLLDTAGLERAREISLTARMTAMSQGAITEADVTLMVIDGRAGVTPADKYFADLIRKSHKPAILVVNKAESGKVGSAIAESYALGLGDPVAISAEHGEGMGDLYEALKDVRRGTWKVEGEDTTNYVSHAMCHDSLHLAIVGRPNAGKSTLMNLILGKERVLTGPEAGITRDAIAVDCEFAGSKLRLVDTAGMRRKSNIVEKVEKLAVADALHTVAFAHVVILVIDAQAPLEKQDNHIAALVEQEGRAMVIAVNKWDTVGDKPAYLKAIHQRLESVLAQVKDVPVVPISAKAGFGIPALMKACFNAYAAWNKEIPTAQLNRWLEAALDIHTPPLIKGRRIKIRYMTQKSARPPTFILFANTGDIPEAYLRYLVNSMREAFRLPGTPIRIKIRKNKNPYAKT
ncbi:MAG: ribosome biogenesis GTPase Der [Pseudomonadota bacterium]|nr:ribosome biogenesis GTPase Der [Pseudomonadota bacterium]MDE3038926.1 ribosome biogenesis GTPase Der [Pseudomonadota bacterium]